MTDPTPISEEGSQIKEPRIVQKAAGMYTATWRNSGHIYCAFLSPTLSLREGPFEITDSGDYCSQYSYDIAYLFPLRKLFVVWVDRDEETTPTSSCTFYKLLLRIVESDGSMGTIHEIYCEDGQIPCYPQIAAATSDKLLIVWRSDEGGASEQCIRAKLISDAGTTLSDYSLTELSNYKYTDVVYDDINDRFVIVFDRGDGELYGRIITFGGVLDHEFHILSRSAEVGGSISFLPISLAFLDNEGTANFLLGYHQYEHRDDRYQARLKTVFMSGNGIPAIGASQSWGSDSSMRTQGHVCVAGGMINNEDKFVIAYEEGQYRETGGIYRLDSDSYSIYRDVR